MYVPENSKRYNTRKRGLVKLPRNLTRLWVGGDGGMSVLKVAAEEDPENEKTSLSDDVQAIRGVPPNGSQADVEYQAKTEIDPYAAVRGKHGIGNGVVRDESPAAIRSHIFF
ncbi:hypothetical protein E8E12_010417 [Didymella heteroderae]|uniref:Uncharacterized protein n=1 Tax=Didymella heteroderae TaxID=1769908 RepID=A0A9P4WXA9_9PLEO|nr:hypothetical protein E8E12_010417 [Didymella heteroderae]